MKITKLVPLQDLLRRYLDNADLSLAEHDYVTKALSRAAGQVGAQPGAVFVVEVKDNNGNTTYDLGFHDTDPGNAGALITIKQTLSREWIPANKIVNQAKAKEEAEASSSSS